MSAAVLRLRDLTTSEKSIHLILSCRMQAKDHEHHLETVRNNFDTSVKRRR
jgi:hypothetical protein